MPLFVLSESELLKRRRYFSGDLLIVSSILVDTYVVAFFSKALEVYFFPLSRNTDRISWIATEDPLTISDCRISKTQNVHVNTIQYSANCDAK